MRKIIVLSFVLLIRFAAPAQKITYNIPEGYEKEISEPDYKKLVDESVKIISTRYKIQNVASAEVHVKADTVSQTFNLHNLILKCAATKIAAERSEIIKSHFESIFASIDEKKKINLDDFASIRKYLSIRIYPEEFVTGRGGVENLVSRKDLEGTYTLLMLDLPGSFSIVLKENFINWKKDIAEAFKTAQDNINKQPVEKLTQQLKIDAIEIEASFIGEENYAASYALDLLNNSPEMVGEWGSAIAIPNKGLVNICKISREKPVDFVKFIQKTKPFVEKYFAEHPQQISDQYFWYYKGKFTKIAVLEDDKGNIQVISPLGLAELMTTKK